MAICIDDLGIHVQGNLSDLVGMVVAIIKSHQVELFVLFRDDWLPIVAE